MKLYLSRESSGKYMLTAFEPIKIRVRGTQTIDFFVKPGDPIGLRHFCANGIKAMFNIELGLLETIRVDVSGIPILTKPK